MYIFAPILACKADDKQSFLFDEVLFYDQPKSRFTGNNLANEKS